MSATEDFAAFVSARYGALVRTALLLGAPPADAEDAVQEALIACFRAWKSTGPVENADAYAHRVLLNRLSRRARRRWRGEVPHAFMPGDFSTGDHAGQVAVAETVRSALSRLGSDQRAVVVLRYFADLTEAQTAQALRIPTGTVKSRASRALAQLARDPGLARLSMGAGRDT